MMTKLIATQTSMVTTMVASNETLTTKVKSTVTLT
jgi:hypothetical protein